MKTLVTNPSTTFRNTYLSLTDWDIGIPLRVTIWAGLGSKLKSFGVFKPWWFNKNTMKTLATNPSTTFRNTYLSLTDWDIGIPLRVTIWAGLGSKLKSLGVFMPWWFKQ